MVYNQYRTAAVYSTDTSVAASSRSSSRYSTAASYPTDYSTDYSSDTSVASTSSSNRYSTAASYLADTSVASFTRSYNQYRTPAGYPTDTSVASSTRSSRQAPSLPWSPPRTRRSVRAESELYREERKPVRTRARNSKQEFEEYKRARTPSPTSNRRTPSTDLYDSLHPTTEHTPKYSLPKIPALKRGVSLYPHQVKGVAWMFDREQPSQGKFGGLNADAMGMGKTLQAIALVAYPRKDAAQLERDCTAPTLVICPANLIPQWMKMITSFSTLSSFAFHGRERNSMQIEKYDIVVTSYHTLLNEHKNFEARSKHDRKVHPVYGRKWLRVILDESQYIKKPQTKSCQACLQIPALFRWCLTGTPIQNSVTDFYSLFQFLKISPVSDRVYFDYHISKPLKNNPANRRAIQRLHDSLLPIMIRRSKDILTLPGLPHRTFKLVRCPFGRVELAFYNALSERMTELIEGLIRKAESQGRQFYTTVLVMLLRLRQACDHPELILRSNLDDFDEEEEEDGASDEGDHCQICQAYTRSTSGYCRNCYSDTILGRIRKMEGRPSTKLKTLLRILSDISTQSDGMDKTAVYSRWTSMLDLASLFLTERGIKHVHYRGGMSMDERQRSLKAIADDRRVSVILVSLMAGGTGLNLTACNHLVLLDPWWNPAVEEQAFDRIHRIGQTKPVFIYKLIIEDPTVEDHILEIQEGKRRLSDNILSVKEDERRGDEPGIQQLLTCFPDLSRTAVNKVMKRR